MLDLLGRENPEVKAHVYNVTILAPKPCSCCAHKKLHISFGVVCSRDWVWFNCICGSTQIVKKSEVL